MTQNETFTEIRKACKNYIYAGDAVNDLISDILTIIDATESTKNDGEEI